MHRLRHALLSLFLCVTVTAHPVTEEARDVPIGTFITGCRTPGTIALTYDDGPSPYTPQLLDILGRYGAKATFFILGSGWRGDIDNWELQWPYVLQRIHAEGHQLASHTWLHADLSVIPWDTLSHEILRTEQAFLSVMGFMPTYIRPPHLSCSGMCTNFLGNLGYKIISADLDTKDWDNSTPDKIWKAKEIFDQKLDEGGSLVLAHDIHEQTVVSLTPYMLETLLARGLKPVTVGECLGDNPEAWYRGPR